jgi:hypothetical protein
MQEGILDLNVPMAYFRQTTYAADWAAWTQFAKDHRYRRHVALGAGIYLNSLSNSLVQIRSVRNATPTGNRADGFAGFCYGATSTDATRTDFLNALTKPSSFDPNPPPVYQQVAPAPDMPWKTSPLWGHLKGFVLNGLTGEELDGATVRVTGPASKTLTADATGFYGAVDLSPGQYTVTASFSGLVPQSNTLAVAAAQVATCDFCLFPTAGDAFLANVSVSAGLMEAVVSWQTPAPATAQLEYGPAPNATTLSPFDGVLGTNHSISVAGLGKDTDYVFRVISQAGTNEYRSSLRSFRTAGEVIVDNQAASFSGGWSLGSSATDKYSVDYQYAGTVSGAATATAAFVPQITTPGYYDVFVWYPAGGNRSASAPFEVVYDGGSVVVRVNQTASGGDWRLLAGNKHFVSGANGLVRLANNTGESSKVVVADAVRWAYTAGQEPAPGMVGHAYLWPPRGRNRRRRWRRLLQLRRIPPRHRSPEGRFGLARVGAASQPHRLERLLHSLPIRPALQTVELHRPCRPGLEPGSRRQADRHRPRDGRAHRRQRGRAAAFLPRAS